MSARRTILFTIAGIVLAFAAWYALFAHQAPSGQPPLAVMDVTALQSEFNRAIQQTRVIVLLSPT